MTEKLTGHADAESSRVFTSAPFISDLGIRLEHLAPGECESSLKLEPRHMQQDGFVHAGVQATIADHTAGAAGASVLRSGQMVLTAEFKINLLRAAKGQLLWCKAKVVKPGSRITFAQSEVWCQDGDDTRLVATAAVTLAVVPATASDSDTRT
jgi:uncharacterized protein (TIGR00369 family)